MDFQMLDYLDKAVAQDFESDNTLLIKESVLSTYGHIVLNKINLMTGAYASNLADRILEADMGIPYLFMQLPSHTQILQYYINELITDLKDYNTDQSD